MFPAAIAAFPKCDRVRPFGCMPKDTIDVVEADQQRQLFFIVKHEAIQKTREIMVVATEAAAWLPLRPVPSLNRKLFGNTDSNSPPDGVHGLEFLAGKRLKINQSGPKFAICNVSSI